MTDYKTQARLRAQEIITNMEAEFFNQATLGLGTAHDTARSIFESHIAEGLNTAYEQGRQDVLARWPSEDEWFEIARNTSDAEGAWQAYNKLRERLGV